MFDSLIPADDKARLETLSRYQVLDARNERVLDEVVALTAQIFHVSNAMISLIEEHQVLVKAPYNLPIPVERVPRENSLCSATILQADTAVYENLAEAGPPHVDTSLVRQLGLNFYAGHNLRTPDGFNIGSLCLYDPTPRQFSEDERRLLAVLAGIVMRLLDLRLALGATPDTSFALWEPVYNAIGGQLSRLRALATQAEAHPEAFLADAKAIASIIDQFIAATLKRV